MQENMSRISFTSTTKSRVKLWKLLKSRDTKLLTALPPQLSQSSISHGRKAMIEQLRRGVPENQCPIYLRSGFCSKFSCTRHINCKLFYQDFLEQSNLANHLKENLRRFHGRGLEKLFSVLSRAKITMVTEGADLGVGIPG